MNLTPDTAKSMLNALFKLSIPGFKLEAEAQYEPDGIYISWRLFDNSVFGRVAPFWQARRSVPMRVFSDMQSLENSEAFIDVIALKKAFDAHAAKEFERGMAVGLEEGYKLAMKPFRDLAASFAEVMRVR